MTNLFKKAAIFTDLHLGMKSNSHTHNSDCERYLDWFIDLTKTEGCDMILFLGDFHHNRNSININTMDYSLRLLQKLDDLGLRVMFIPGNHDLYHKDKRTLSSVKYIDKFKNIELINEQLTEGDVAFVPWLIGDEYKSMKRIRAKYVMGHFELPHFKMNAMVEMPDHGELQVDDFKGVDYVFSGHFHKRQNKGNIHYIGNAFPHNYADAWDDDRGMMILEWGGQPEYHAWPNQPTFRTVKLSQLIDDADIIIKPKQHLRVSLDIDISYEEASFIKEKFISDYNIRELTLITERKEVEMNTNIDIQAFESVDQIVSNQIVNIDSDTYNKNKLLEIYNSL